LVAVAVGDLGGVIGEGLLQVLAGARGLEVVGFGLDQAALEAVLAGGEAQVVVLTKTASLARR
jgi:hypothetical protein